MKFAKYLTKGDRGIWGIVLFLSFISIVEVYSAAGLSKLFDHLIFIGIGYVGIVFLSNINFRVFSKLSLYGYYFAIITLVAALVSYFFFDTSTDGAGRWVKIGDNIKFQPSEYTKVLLIVYVAALIEKYKDTLQSKETFKKLLISIAIPCGLILPQNFSTAAMLFLCCFTMLFLGKVSKKYMRLLTIIGLLALAVGGLFIVKSSNNSRSSSSLEINDNDIFRNDTWGKRITNWLNYDPKDNTQENIARRAVATGGLWIRPGNTIQGRMLNESHNDFIYAVIIEELGTFIGIFILLLYSVLFYRCIIIANKCKNIFCALTVSGLGLIIYLQALINMGVAVGYLPVTGQTLPFVSYGGSSFLFFSCFAIGIIQSISKTTRKQEQLEKEPTNVETEITDSINQNTEQ